MADLTLAQFILDRNEEEHKAALRKVLIEHLACPVCGQQAEVFLTPATIRGWTPDRPDRVEPCKHELTPEQSDACYRTVISVRVRGQYEAIRAIVEEARDYSPELAEGDNGEWALSMVLGHLGTIWSDHPDYNEDWKP